MSRLKTLFVIISAIAIGTAVVFVIQPSRYKQPSRIEIVRVGVLPDEDEAALKLRYSPLLEHMARETGLKYQLVVPASYADMLRIFADKELEIAYLGGLTFVKAQIFHHARPLVMRDVDTRFTTYFVTRADGPLRDCESLKCEALAGKVLSFGSKLSTSGHLMPRHFLKLERRIEPESYFGEVRYSGAHDKTIYQARDGEVDLGAVNAEIFRTMRRDGRLKQDDLRIIWETPPYPDYVWAINGTLTKELRTRLRNAFLMLEMGDKEHARILAAMGTHGFLPAGTAEFAPLKKIAQSLGLLKLVK